MADAPDFSHMSLEDLVRMRDNIKAGVPYDAAKPLPGHGQPTWQAPDGSWLTHDAKTGEIKMITDPDTKAQAMRTKTVLGSMVKAQQDLFTQEGWASGKPVNPYNSDPAANVATDPASGGGLISHILGGAGHVAAAQAARGSASDQWQVYHQSAKAMQDMIMPLLMGMRQTQSAAPRILDSYIPQPGDHPVVLSQKALARAKLINDAATGIGMPRPFPRADTEHHYQDLLKFRQGVAPADPRAAANQALIDKSAAAKTPAPADASATDIYLP